MIHAPSVVLPGRSEARRARSTSARLVVTPANLGTGAFARLIRDGALQELSAGVAASQSLAALPHVRAAALAHLVPRRGVLTGLSALWVHGWLSEAPLPAPVTVAAITGVRLSEPVGAHIPWRAVIHDGSITYATSVGAIPVALPEPAVAMALSHDALEQAIPAAWWALTHCHVSTRAIGELLPRRGPTARRASAAWRTVTAAWNEA